MKNIQRTKPKESKRTENGGLHISPPPQPSNNRTANYDIGTRSKKTSRTTKHLPEPHRTITRAEYDQLISHPRFTPVHRLILDEKLKRGEWLIET
jgi:hypothetical protein